MPSLLHNIAKAREAFQRTHGRDPSNHELASAVDISVDRLRLVLSASRGPVSLDSQLRRGGRAADDQRTLGDTIPDLSADPAQHVEARLRRQTLATALHSVLPPEEHAVICSCYNLLEGRQRAHAATPRTPPHPPPLPPFAHSHNNRVRVWAARVDRTSAPTAASTVHAAGRVWAWWSLATRNARHPRGLQPTPAPSACALCFAHAVAPLCLRVALAGELSYQEIGERFGRTSQWVEKVEERALKRLKGRSYLRNLLQTRGVAGSSADS